jgi:anthranilate synthase component I
VGAKILEESRGGDIGPGGAATAEGIIKDGAEYTSNIGKRGTKLVTALKAHIRKGDIIQAVPSQRITRPTTLHPFNVYRKLRTVNPSPYLFFIDCGEFQIIGASP